MIGLDSLEKNKKGLVDKAGVNKIKKGFKGGFTLFTRKKTAYKIFVVIAYLGVITTNALANIIPIGGVTTGEVSDSYPNFFAPAGFTFGIWAVIYLLLGAYVLYQFGLFRRQLINERIFQEIAPYFIISSLANILWIFAWHNFKIAVSLFLMIAILLSLIKIQYILKRFKLYSRDKLFIRAPFSIYFGWITVATIANITTYLVSINWSGFGLSDVTWTVIILIVGLMIGSLTIFLNKDLVYGGVIIWAYFGILFKHTSPYDFGGKYVPIILTVILSIIILSMVMAYIGKKLRAFFVILILLVVVSTVFISFRTYKAMDEAVKAKESPNVTVQDRTIVFNPEDEAIANLVFYQGGLVQPQAYAVLGQMLSEQGVRVFIPRMPLNLSILNASSFDKIHGEYEDGNDWYIGGHSLGGATASIYAKNNSENIEGIFFLGAYPSDRSDLSGFEIDVLSINASLDSIIDRDKYEQTKSLLPQHTVYVEIEGGNHSNFGYYGLQKGDEKSTITRKEQHKVVSEKISEMIE
ncbi:alpha/beta hydrolase [Proteinivorax tanatarense]|uniref:Alpha/beta hydrolase n=1 Tax=Proteinivorax tanatarense TaxID=1260629 RepID=A0AAU7VMA1_9FIRM